MFIDGLLTMWFVLTGLSILYITYDLIFVTPEAGVMKLGWWLVTLYTGPIGLFFYLLSCKEPLPETHEIYIAALWKQSLGSMVHCLAGDVTGIILAAFILTFIRIPLGWEVAVEYLAGFTFGWFIFQSLFMKSMMGGTYLRALKGSFYPEWLSMNMIMAGMIPVMVIWQLLEEDAWNPATLHFWGKMSLATIVGGLCAFPINRWLVKSGLKHGMMTIRKGKMMSMHHEEVTVTKGQVQGHLWLSLLGLACGISIAILAYTQLG